MRWTLGAERALGKATILTSACWDTDAVMHLPCSQKCHRGDYRVGSQESIRKERIKFDVQRSLRDVIMLKLDLRLESSYQRIWAPWFLITPQNWDWGHPL